MMYCKFLFVWFKIWLKMMMEREGNKTLGKKKKTVKKIEDFDI